jgi:hypothetical protein
MVEGEQIGERMGRNKSRSEAGNNREGDVGGTNRGAGEPSSKVGQFSPFLGITALSRCQNSTDRVRRLSSNIVPTV